MAEKDDRTNLVTITHDGESVTFDKSLLKNASLGTAFKAVEIYNSAKMEGLELDKIGLGNIEDQKFLYRYLGNVLSKNSGSRGRDKRYELGQIQLVYDQLEPLFSEYDMSQAPEKGGRRKTVNTGKRQSGGFDPLD